MRLALAGEQLDLVAGQLVSDALEVADLSLNCHKLRAQPEKIECVSGELSAPGWLDQADFEIHVDMRSGGSNASLSTLRGESISASLDAGGYLAIRFDDWLIERLPEHLAIARDYTPQGRLSGSLSGNLHDTEAGFEVLAMLSDGGFASESGMQAAEGLGVSLDATVSGAGSTWRIRLSLDWDRGELYFHPFYVPAGLAAKLHGSLHDKQLQVERASVHLPGVGGLEMYGTVELEPFGLSVLELRASDLDLALLGDRFVLPALVPALATRLELSGTANGRLRLSDAELQTFDLNLADVRLGLDEGRLDIGPVAAKLPWRRGEDSQITAVVDGARWESLALGRFEIEAALSGSALVFERLAIPILDGRLLVSDLGLEMKEDGLYGSGSLVLEPVSIESLTTALELPTMTGVLSAALPGLRLSPGSLVLDGSLVVSLFDGYLQVENLVVREPFGVASFVSADVKATRMNLGQITNTFAFGSISGFVDAEILGLELVRWRPVAFDARIVSSPGRYTKRISQRAVQNIGALSGGGAAVALQRGVLGFFDSFGYRELGLSCRMSNNDCLMSGVEDQKGEGGGDGGFVIVRGGGIPSLNVIGYNRRVNWQDLLDRLQAAIASNEGPVID